MSRQRGVQAAAIVSLILLYYGIQLLTRLFAVYPYLGLPSEWTQHGNWVQMTDHHLWQMTFALAVIFVLSLGRWRDWGLNLRNLDESLRLLKKFCFAYGIYFIGIGLLFQWLFLPVPLGTSKGKEVVVRNGVPIVDLLNRATFIPSFEAVEEMRVQSSAYDAEVGRTSGGVFNTIARSGTNAWTGRSSNAVTPSRLRWSIMAGAARPRNVPRSPGGTSSRVCVRK